MYKTSEWVSLGHPDKMADYISEKILDYYIKQDPKTRYALEVQIKDNYVTLGGEITSIANITKEDRVKIVKEAIRQIGYTKEYQDKFGKENTICDEDIIVQEHISQQSRDIAVGVNDNGWGDQGIFWGMATNNVLFDYLPKDYFIAKKIGEMLYNRKIGGLDIKTQVTLKNNNIDQIVVAIPSMKDITNEVKEAIKDIVKIDEGYKLIINGTGVYKKHGPIGDCGTTGRKLAVDFYGGNCVIGGGSPWTKDGTKADLTLNLYARKKALDYIKKHINIDQVYCSISCVIGQSNIHYSIMDKCGNEIESGQQNIEPRELINQFNLSYPIYSKLCRNGLFSTI